MPFGLILLSDVISIEVLTVEVVLESQIGYKEGKLFVGEEIRMRTGFTRI